MCVRLMLDAGTTSRGATKANMFCYYMKSNPRGNYNTTPEFERKTQNHTEHSTILLLLKKYHKYNIKVVKVA